MKETQHRVTLLVWMYFERMKKYSPAFVVMFDMLNLGFINASFPLNTVCK